MCLPTEYLALAIGSNYSIAEGRIPNSEGNYESLNLRGVSMEGVTALIRCTILISTWCEISECCMLPWTAQSEDRVINPSAASL